MYEIWKRLRGDSEITKDKDVIREGFDGMRRASFHALVNNCEGDDCSGGRRWTFKTICGKPSDVFVHAYPSEARWASVDCASHAGVGELAMAMRKHKIAERTWDDNATDAGPALLRKGRKRPARWPGSRRVVDFLVGR